MADPQLLTQVRELYLKWTGNEIAEAHRILRQEFDALSLTPGRILSATDTVVDKPTPLTTKPKPRVSRVSKETIPDPLPCGEDHP